MVNVNGQKMGKSLGNFLTIKDALNSYHPDIIRYAILSYNLSSPIDFNKDLFRIARKRVYYFYTTLKEIDDIIKDNEGKSADTVNHLGTTNDEMIAKFENAMNDNFNFSKVMANLSDAFNTINDFIVSKEYSKPDKVFTLKAFREKLCCITDVINIFDEDPEKILQGFKTDFLKDIKMSEASLMQKIAERNNYKRDKDYKNADSIRDELNKL
jgi:cysteinyl-tRNA synthetase